MKLRKIDLETILEPKIGYITPFEHEIKIFQGYNGKYSHMAFERNGFLYDDRFCTDYILPLGTDVLASKSGEVWGSINTMLKCYEGTDMEKGLKCFPNFIVIKHSEGEYSLYSHLEKGSVSVRRKEKVEQGDVIARTGKSGWIGPVPHLHFSVCDISPKGKKLSRQSFPVIFD